MGSMRDEMAKVINDWDKSHQSVQQPQPENAMQETADLPQAPQTLSAWCIEAIKKAPGITGSELRSLYLKVHPESGTQVPATLSHLFNRGWLRREVRKIQTQFGERETYAYIVATPEELAEANKLREEELKKAKQRRQWRNAKRKSRDALSKAKKKKPFVPHPNSLANLRPKKAESPQAELPLEPRVDTPAPAPASEKISVEAAVTLTIKGQKVALTMTEAKELHSALSAVVVV